ncbi:hypothetical protein E4U58_001607 [Claviceps cyperi]|nr:hypothetical protein E4U58_001607 [Claviceps cyperi]
MKDVYFFCRLCVAQKEDDPETYEESDTRSIERHLSKAHNVHEPDPSSKTRRSLPKRALDQPDLRSFLVKKQKTDGAQKESVARMESIDRPTFQRRLVQWATNANPAVDILEHSELRDTHSLALCLSGENLLTAADWKALDWFNHILSVFD